MSPPKVIAPAVAALAKPAAHARVLIAVVFLELRKGRRPAG
jgi:hypothetical protein